MKRLPTYFALLLLALLQGCSSEKSSTPPTDTADHGTEADDHDEHGHGSDEAGHDDHGHDAHGHGEEEEHGEEHGHGHGEEGEPDFAAMGAEQASAAGVVVDTAQIGVVDAGLLLSGNLVIDPQRMAQVRARFPGLIREMRKEVGDTVARGEALATVESNESLTSYSVTAPIGGVVLERHANRGDVSGDGPMYTIGDTGALQAELKVFPSSIALVHKDAPVTVLIGDTEISGTVTAILPALDTQTQARRVRVTLAGAPATGLTAGLFVSARLAIDTSADQIVIPMAAVKQLEGRDVVFVPGESGGKAGFRAREVVLGERGRLRVALRAGLEAGERYVADGAFLLKAEIGKNQAAHEH